MTLDWAYVRLILGQCRRTELRHGTERGCPHATGRGEVPVANLPQAEACGAATTGWKPDA